MIVLRFDTTTVAVDDVAPEGDLAAQRAVVARLLDTLLPGASLSHRHDGAPRVNGADIFISVSHTSNAAAVAIDSERRIGIDLEKPRFAQLHRVKDRFLRPDELEFYGHEDYRLLQAWTLKEALIKASGRVDADLRADLLLPLPGKRSKASVMSRNGSSEGFDIIHSAPVDGIDADVWLSVTGSYSLVP